MLWWADSDKEVVSGFVGKSSTGKRCMQFVFVAKDESLCGASKA